MLGNTEKSIAKRDLLQEKKNVRKRRSIRHTQYTKLYFKFYHFSIQCFHYPLPMQIHNELQLKECFEKYADMLYRLCLFRLHGDEMAATDLVQESFYRAGLELEK